ncbi:XrtN system VIT domain-containing protein [Flammeovirgaceae bacterium SG7u.111]|nr:XrtN system VIT domain-containing protein [Flammeovirgaceae bacterium SG7u.132]WPO36032.1 XrtN system VIT domain-containing protein [Flammeovirgaceae bacterium SG7u.111]
MEQITEKEILQEGKVPSSSKLKFKWSPMSLAGIVMVLASLGFYYLSIKNNLEEASFFVNFVLVFSYFFIRIVFYYPHFKLKFWKHPASDKAFAYTLFLISCFALNEEMRVFSEFPAWLLGYTVLVQFALIIKSHRVEVPTIFDAVLVFLIGSGLVLHGYLAIYLIPIYPFSAILFFFIGLSLHSFVPLANFILLFKEGKNSVKKHNYMRTPLILGIASPIIILIWFLSSVGIIHQDIESVKKDYLISKQGLPEWMYIDQHITKNAWTNKAFELHLNTEINRSNDFLWIGFDRGKEHNPMVFISNLFLGKLGLDRNAAELISKSDHGNRHNFNRRLWRGTHLATSTIRTDVEVFPQHRLAYFQKTFTIENQNKNSWPREEEALYTFHLPEGAIGTSLSLWINGKEEKGALTTRHKADSAYSTIVGVERRDPALMHWQEGNRITVSVFPCTSKEARKFEVGFTMPMRLTDGQLVVDNIAFQGPNSTDAMEAVKLKIVGKMPEGSQMPNGFYEAEDGTFVKESTSKNEWIYQQPLLDISPATFAWGGYEYQAFAPQFRQMPTSIEQVYLDIDQSWDEDLWEEVWEGINHLEVFAFDGGELIKMNEENQEKLFRKLARKNYGLPALHLVSQPKSSLIISKSNSFSPLLEDMEGIDFAYKMNNFLNKDIPKIKLLDLGETPSPYVQSLNELGCFHYLRGDVDMLITTVDKQTYPQVELAENDTYIPQAQMVVRKSESYQQSAGTAPDHLMRVHAFGQLMKNLRASYFDKNQVTEEQIALAKEAYVVSPFSSLVSLESQEDYDRFDIDNSVNGLGNAAISNSGAVPEPHEWALIIIGLGFLAFMIWRRKMRLV